jgi:hypothetical protein
LKELENAGLIVCIPSASIHSLDRFYVVPGLGRASKLQSPDVHVHQGGDTASAMGNPSFAVHPLSQEKLEHAVLWVLVRDEFKDERADSFSIRRRLNDVAGDKSIHAALEHLEQCGYASVEVDPGFRNYTPTRKGIQHIEKLETRPTSFIGRLAKHGPQWLTSKAAQDAQLFSKIEGPSPVPAAPTPSSYPGVTINNNVNPVQNVSGSFPPTPANPYARSSARAGWTNATLGLLSLIVAIIAIYVAVQIGGHR